MYIFYRITDKVLRIKSAIITFPLSFIKKLQRHARSFLITAINENADIQRIK